MKNIYHDGYLPVKNRFLHIRTFNRNFLLICCLWLLSGKAFAQTVEHGHEAASGVLNFTDMANYLLAHPETPHVREIENEEEDDVVIPSVSLVDPSMVHARTTSRYRSFIPVTSGLPTSSSPIDTFQSTLDNNTAIPPDTHGAVDSNYCVTTINTTVKIQSRTGGGVSSVSLDAFWSPVLSGGGSFDPRVHYDPYTHRWIIVAVSGAFASSSSILIAVSQTSNPTGSWYMYKITADATGVNWLDFPNVGFNGKWITVTGNFFSNSSGSFGGAKVYIFNKTNLMNGTGASYTGILQTGASTICPALTYSSSLGNMFCVDRYNGSAGYMRVWKITGNVGSETMSTVGYSVSSTNWWYTSNTVSGTTFGDFAPQSGTSNLLNAGDDRVTQLIYQNGSLWWAHTVFLPYNASANPTRCAVQWWQTDTAANPIQIGLIDGGGTSANYYAYPTIAVNSSNDALIGFAVMSSSMHPSAGYAMRLHTDATDSIRPLQIFRHGQNTYYKTYSGSKNRWGDYSATCVDPLNNNDFWTIQEAASATANTWDTWWAHIAPCTAPAAITGTTSVCAGSTTTLSDATSGGTWSSSTTSVATIGSTSGIVSGVSSGTATISYTSSSGCSVTTVVTVNPVPAAISGTTSVCTGATTTLTDGTSGGTWSSGTTSVATIGSTTGIVTGVAAGTTSISYTLTSTGCRTITTVTVNTTPAAITGTMSVCVGSTTTLSDATSGGTWSSSSTSVATVGSTTGTVTGVGSGTATISYNMSSGCRAIAVVTVNALPSAISGTTSVCVGSTTTLTDGTTGGTWSSGTTSVATIGSTTGILAGVSSGTTLISYTLTSTGCQVVTTATVNPVPAAISGTTSVCIGSTTTLTDGTSGGTWSSGSTSIATVGSTTGTVTGVAAGTANISYTLSTGCRAIASVTVNSLPAAITGTTSVCAGSTTTLSDGTSGGTWLSSNTSVASVGSTTGVVSGVSSGTATISYVVSATGCRTTTNVTVNPLPSAISGASSVCAGTTTTLTNGTSGGTWSSSTTSVATIGSTTGIVTGVTAGTTTISYTLTSTGCRVTQAFTVNALPSAISGPTAVCAGSSTTLTDGTSGGTWSSNNTSVATIGSTTGIVNGVATGTTTITYTLSTGCFTTRSITVSSSPTAISGVSSICAGATTTLTNGVSGGTWSSNNTSVATVGSTSGVVTGVSGGTATITYSLGSSCNVTFDMTVNTAPAVIVGASTLCVGNTSTYTDVTSGGTWASSNTAVGTIDATTGDFTAIAAGTTTITYSTGTGCPRTMAVAVITAPASITGTTTVCTGTTTTLADATSGGTWSSSDATVASVGSTTGIVTGVAAGTATITYSIGASCFVTAPVTVNSAPSSISGTPSVCSGSSTTLTDVTSGGVWSSSNTSVATVGSATGTVTGVSAGTATITYSLGASCRTTVTFTVNGTPAAISGATSVCEGATITLSNSVSGGIWSSNSTGVATVGSTSGIVSGVTAGAVTISYTNSCGTATKALTVNAAPAAITGTTSVCIGSTSALSSTTSGGTWSSSNSGIASVGSTGIVSGVSAGTATISYILASGCRATATITVGAPPAAISGSGSVCVGVTTTFTDATSGGTWSSSDNTIASIDAASGIATGVGAGTAIITYTSAPGCVATASLTVISAPAAITGTTYVCIGSTTTLSDATPGGTWISADGSIATVGSASGIVTGVSAGTVAISYSLGTSCVAVTTVTVNAVPSAISGANNVCIGATTTFTNTTSGGVWSSSNTAVATVDAASGDVTGVGSGSATITYASGIGCIATKGVTVDPAAITGPSGICIARTATLVDASSGGTWSSSNTAAATIGSTTGIVSGIAGGTSVISYTTSAGCTATTTITVFSTPAPISGPSNLCIGIPVALTHPVSGGTWSSSYTAVATIGSLTGIVTGLGTGPTSTITYMLAPGCIATKTVAAFSSPAAITGTKVLCVGSTTTLFDVTASCTWSSGDITMATISSGGVVTGLSAGTVNISYTNSGGCFAYTTVTVNPLPAAITGSTNLCVGSSITLTDTTAGGTWSGSNGNVTVGSTTGIVTGVLVGTSVIRYKLISTGCLQSSTVTINSMPSAITGASSVCAGSTTTLSDGTSGGTWSSGSALVATVGSTTGVVTGVSAGTTTITYSVGTGCTATKAFTVNGSISAITGTTGVCVGATTTLGNATSGGTWSSASPSIASIGSATGTVTGVSSGTAIISYTLPTGCRATTTVTVNPLPAAITGTASVCEGATTTLSDATPAGTWSSSDVTTASVDIASGVVTGVVAGTATITYTSAAGCTTTRVVTVNPAPAVITGTAELCTGTTTTLSDATSGGTWSSGSTGTATVGSVTGVVTGVSAGITTITYRISTGCTALVAVSVDPLPALITGAASICLGSVSTFSDVTSGGTWSSSNSSIVSIDATTGDATGVATGNAVITYTSAQGCIRTTTATVISAPAGITGTTSVCAGATTTLSNTSTGGTWSSSDGTIATIGSSSGVVTGVTPGTATITYSVGTSCTAIIVVTVSAAPTAITGTTSLCAGTSTTLSNATTGGTWSSSNTSVATINSSTGMLNGVSAGTAIITYSFSASCYTTTTVTINALPAAITGASRVCIGSTTTLSDATSGGTWSSSNSGIASIDAATGDVTGASVGTVSITYTTAAGCIATKAFTVNPLPSAITGTTSVCVGSTTTLSDATTGGAWSSSDATIASVGSTSGIVTGIAAGSVNITYASSLGCSVTTTLTVNDLPASITGGTALCVGSSSTLSDATIGGTWSSSNTAVATIGSSTGIVTGGSAGSATITYTSAAGCVATTPVTVISAPSSITGTTSICNGASSTLSNATTGGVWSSSDNTVASIGSSTGIVTSIAPGSATITYSLGSGCFTTTSVVVNPLPAVYTMTGGGSYCSGGSGVNVGLSGTESFLFTYQLYVSGTPVGTPIMGTGAALDFGLQTSAGVYTAVAISSAGCTSDMSGSVAVSINPLPAPITGTMEICEGATTTLTDATSGGTWSTATTGVATVGSASGVVTGISAGLGYITYTLSTGCYVRTTVTVDPTPAAITGTTSFCAGSTSTLSNTVGGGSWSSSDATVATVGSSSGVVTGVAAGTAVITYSLGSGCFTMVTVTINSLPAAISGASQVCIGLSATLTDGTSGGTWSTSDGSLATIGSATGIVTGVAIGNVTITYMLSSGCYNTTTLNVIGSPSAITGATSMCSGLTSTLSDATPGGTWSSSNTSIATVGSVSGIVTGVSVGTATISYALGAGCVTTTTVTINSLPPAITGASTVCIGASTTFSNTTSGGTWSSSDTTIASVDAATGIVTGVASGSATITYSLGAGCQTTKTISVNPSAITGASGVCIGFTTTLTDATSGGIWSSSNTSIATIGSTTGVVSGIAGGNATISYTSSGGCVAVRSMTVVTQPAPITGVSSLCRSLPYAFTDATAGGTWSSSNTAVATVGSSTGIVTGLGTGPTATITYALVPGCIATKTVVVVAGPAAITGVTSVCVGSTTTLSDVSGGGTWSSSSTAVATVNTTGIVTGVSAGTVSISYTTSGGCYQTATVTVNPLPSAIIGIPRVCVGSTTTLSDTTAGGAWTNSNSNATIGSATGIVTGVTAGSSVVTYKLNATGCRATASLTINPAAAVITGASTLCAGSSISLSDGSTGGTWSSSNTSVATVGSTGVVTGVGGGTTSISYTITSTGCYAVKTITVNPLPDAGTISGTTTVAVAATTTLTTTGSGGSWTSSSSSIATVGSGTGVVTGVAVGTVTISYSVTNTCGTARSTTTVTVVSGPGPIGGGGGGYPEDTTTAVDQTNITNSAIIVYPNPTSTTMVTIKASVNGVFTLYTLMGKEVMSYKVRKGATELNLPSSLAAGTYSGRFTGDDGTITTVRIIYAP